MSFRNINFVLVALIMTSSLAVVFSGYSLAKTKTKTKTNTSSLDLKIENIKNVYSLSEGWDLSQRSSGSISFTNSYLLSQIDKKLDKYRSQISKRISPAKDTNNVISLKEGVIENIHQLYGKAASERVYAWQKITYLTKNLSFREKLKQVNKFFNRLAFKSDQTNWGVGDYWSSPIEFLISNSGDCEDYAIAKYLTLKAMGVQIDHLRIAYVKAANLNQAHMVLAYYEHLDQDPLILDNLNSQILPASQRPDLVPVFSFNG